jgi:hypothetical protein
MDRCPSFIRNRSQQMKRKWQSKSRHCPKKERTEERVKQERIDRKARSQ